MNGETTGTNFAPELRHTTSYPPDTVLEVAGGRAPLSSAAVTLSSGRRYEMDATASGDRLVVRDKEGAIVLKIEVNDAGPAVSFACADGARDAATRIADAWPQAARAAPSLREAIAPPPSSKELQVGGAVEAPISVPRATPLPLIRHPSADVEPPYREGGSQSIPPAAEQAAGASAEPAVHPASAAAAAPSIRDSGRPSVRVRRGPGAVRDSAFISDAPERARTVTNPQPKLPTRAKSIAGPPSSRRAPSLSLEQYAALCAESTVGAGLAFEQALLRYGIPDRDAWKALDRSWQDRLGREPILTLRWMELTARYREHLTRR
jgi:hypothetical protein